ncbi:PLP-dependent aminotransferase family protein [uncultured Treponema sp.]|uniref:MocR-like pyridoxine biosynthesis transcription factor PdxR n=1 Tax=uncultured Treponema sp. TaxID=162155 RepID=UPI0025CDA654|nr:PLP-dependent aminotransferase family protein [uncultured Treponema sp.]
MITVDFAKCANLSLTDFLVEEIKKQILEGKILENEKLPSKRSLSLHLGVSVITVQNAYERLIDAGYLYSIEKRGFFASGLANHLKSKKSIEIVGGNGQTAVFADEGKMSESRYFADFASNSVASGNFPFSLWSKTMRQVLNSGNENLLKKCDVFGSLELRRAICHHLKDFRNMEVCENQIVIGAGSESLYSMLVQFFGRDNVFAVENPGYRKAAEFFKINGTACVHIGIDEKGIIPEELEKSGADIVHISPSHHFPTGIVMNFARRKEILEWAYKKEGRFILEDDYDSEFRFVGKPLPTLQSIDNRNRVIYINTFSKTLSPSFRISYMVLPENLALEFGKKLNFYSCQVSSFEQFTLARFIESGNYEKHINKMKNYYRSLRNNLMSSFQKSVLSKISRIREENSGLHFLLCLEKGIDAKSLQEEWRKQGINIPLLSEYFYGENKNPEIETTFVVNYSGLPRDKISEIVAQMAQMNADNSFPSV